MRFDDASAVEQICYEFKLADYPRGKDRALINNLFNGFPPYTEEEVRDNNININVNFLEGTVKAHDARGQFYGTFLKPGKFFTARTDMGAGHKRSERSAIVTKEIAKRMKRSITYYETFRSKMALDVLHGIGPSGWDTDDYWCPDALGIEDVLIPANTLLTMKNLPFFAIYRSYTAPELIKLTRGENVDPGWNSKLVDACIKWIDQESMALMGNNWPDVWSPEKMAERVKGDGGFYAGDQVPTIDCFDFYFWNDDGKEEGWNRRIILDSWSTPQSAGQPLAYRSELDFGRNQFLYNSKNRKVADKWSEIVTFQFADLSAVAPFRYHSVRSIGFLLYAICHLQNRMRCRFTESIFEALMMYFRVKSMDDAQRALKVDLFNRGFIDETLQFVPANERFQVNAALVELGLRENKQIIMENMSSMTQNQNFSRDSVEKTKFQVMAEMNAIQSMISAGLQQAYQYQTWEYMEIFRRFCNKDSRDPDVVRFRSGCLRQGIPEKMLVPEAWEIEPERVLGAGNKTLEMAIAEQLMQYKMAYDPEAQRQILRDFTLAVTDDPARASVMVPEDPQQMNSAIFLAQAAAGALMKGLPVGVIEGINHIDYIDALLVSLQVAIGSAAKRGGMASQEDIEGMANTAQHLGKHIDIVAQDKNEGQRVNAWKQGLSKMMNMVKAFAQRLQEQQKQQGSPGADGQQEAESAAKIKAMLVQAEAKAANTRESHAQRTAQRQIQFEMEQKRKDVELQNELRREHGRESIEHQARRTEHGLDIVHQARKSAIDIDTARKKSRISATKEPSES